MHYVHVAVVSVSDTHSARRNGARASLCNYRCTCYSTAGAQQNSRRCTFARAPFGSETRDIRDKRYMDHELETSFCGRGTPGPVYGFQQSVGRQVLSTKTTGGRATIGKAARFGGGRVAAHTPEFQRGTSAIGRQTHSARATLPAYGFGTSTRDGAKAVRVATLPHLFLCRVFAVDDISIEVAVRLVFLTNFGRTALTCSTMDSQHFALKEQKGASRLCNNVVMLLVELLDARPRACRFSCRRRMARRNMALEHLGLVLQSVCLPFTGRKCRRRRRSLHSALAHLRVSSGQLAMNPLQDLGHIAHERLAMQVACSAQQPMTFRTHTAEVNLGQCASAMARYSRKLAGARSLLTRMTYSRRRPGPSQRRVRHEHNASGTTRPLLQPRTDTACALRFDNADHLAGLDRLCIFCHPFDHCAANVCLNLVHQLHCLHTTR